MTYCEKCGAAVQEGARFCQSCGHFLAATKGTLRCPNCQEPNPSDSLFCSACGAWLSAASPKPEEPAGDALDHWLDELADDQPAETPPREVADGEDARLETGALGTASLEWVRDVLSTPSEDVPPPEPPTESEGEPAPPLTSEDTKPGTTDEKAVAGIDDTDTLTLEWVQDALRPVTDDLRLPEADLEEIAGREPPSEPEAPPEEAGEAADAREPGEEASLPAPEAVTPPLSDEGAGLPPTTEDAELDSTVEEAGLRSTDEDAGLRSIDENTGQPSADQDGEMRPTDEDAGLRPVGKDVGLETGALGTASLEWVRDVLRPLPEDWLRSKAPDEAEGVPTPSLPPEETTHRPEDDEARSGIDDTDTLTLEWVQDALRPVTGDLLLPEAEGEMAGQEPSSESEISPQEDGEAERELPEQAVTPDEAVPPFLSETITPRPADEDEGSSIDDTGTLSLDWVRGVLESWPEDLFPAEAAAKARDDDAAPPAPDDAELPPIIDEDVEPRPTDQDAGLPSAAEDAGLAPTDEDAGLRPTVEEDGPPPADQESELAPTDEGVVPLPAGAGPSRDYEQPPDWVMDLRESTPSEAPVAADESVEVPSAGEVTRDRVDEPSLAGQDEEAGILAGVTGVLPLEPALAWPHLPRDKPPEATPADDLSQAEALQEVMAQRMMVEGQIAPVGTRVALPNWGYRVIFAMVLLAAVVPFLLQSDWSGTSISVSPEVGSFFDTVEALPPGSRVLMSFDYDPATAEEMDPQARIIMDQLMRKGVNVLTMSLTPQGAAVAQQMLDSMDADYSEREYGESYLNLGYLSGNEAALRAILVQGLPGMFSRDYRDGQPISDFSAMQGISQLEDIEVIIDLAGDTRFVRWWVEQVGSQSEVPLLAAVSGTALVGAEPYYRSDQLQGITGGIAGAAEYEIANNNPGRAVAAMDSQSAVHVLVVLLILVGNVAYIFGASRGEG